MKKKKKKEKKALLVASLVRRVLVRCNPARLASDVGFRLGVLAQISAMGRANAEVYKTTWTGTWRRRLAVIIQLKFDPKIIHSFLEVCLLSLCT